MRRPQVKETNPVYRIGDTVLIPRCGEMLEIEDPDGDVGRLLDLMDGHNTAKEIEAAFKEVSPASVLEVGEVIAQLDDAGLLVDGAAPALPSAYHRERWKRNLGFFETYASLSHSSSDMQAQICDLRVALIGLGGVGSHLSLDLLGVGVENLLVADYDKVELSNLNRQILYTEADIGKSKVGLAVQRLRSYYPAAKIDGVERRIGSAAELQDLIVGRDFVFCMFDRPKLHASRWANEACVRAGIPYLSGGVDTQRALMYLVVPGVTGCAECWRLIAANDEVTRQLREQMQQRHGDVSVGPDMSAFGPLVTTMTAMLITEFVRFVTRIAEPISAGRLMEMRFDDLMLRQAEAWDKLPECPVCGEGMPVVQTA
jgi:molybdopterin/thiamine biosynthesis adenylyltransferase